MLFIYIMGENMRQRERGEVGWKLLFLSLSNVVVVVMVTMATAAIPRIRTQLLSSYKSTHTHNRLDTMHHDCPSHSHGNHISIPPFFHSTSRVVYHDLTQDTWIRQGSSPSKDTVPAAWWILKRVNSTVSWSLTMEEPRSHCCKSRSYLKPDASKCCAGTAALKYPSTNKPTCDGRHSLTTPWIYSCVCLCVLGRERKREREIMFECVCVCVCASIHNRAETIVLLCRVIFLYSHLHSLLGGKE